MKRLYLLCIGLIFLVRCESPTSSPSPPPPPALHANVIMFEGPLFEEDEYSFYYKGRVKNIGNAEAKWIRIYVFIRKSDNTLISQDYTYADDYDLLPGETSAWDIMWLDFEHAIRDQMDKSKTTYEIKWDES